MKVNKKAFNNMVQNILEDANHEFYFNSASVSFAENTLISYVNLKKVRGKDKYDIIVYIDSIESDLVTIRDLIHYVCAELDISCNKILVEL